MKLITLNELRAMPMGTLFTRAKTYNGKDYYTDGSIYVWHMCYPDNEGFGYAVRTVPNSDGEQVEDISMRFYYREDYDDADGTERYYVYTESSLKALSAMLERALAQALADVPPKEKNNVIIGIGTTLHYGA